MIVDALAATQANSILREIPEDQLERMVKQAKNLGAATLSRAADIAAEGLTQMRGATAPRLILELICGRILLPMGDSGDSGLLARLERLERVQGMATSSAPAATPAPVAEKVAAPSVVEKKVEATVEVKEVVQEIKKQAVTPVDSLDIGALRRMWPEVIENVKKRRRLTWSLLSASAQVLALDENIITIAIANPGARDSFIRSESDEILRQAFIDVTGLDRKIEAVVDPSIDINSNPVSRAVRTDEAPTDKTLLSGAALLAAELGATVIPDKKSNK
jgi:DNA polymerase-3 subunit gamma/tau